MKIIKTAFLAFFTAGYLMAFDWPQKNADSSVFSSYFGQLRGEVINSSLIFKDNAEVKASAEGKITAVITEHADDFGWFESSLGNAVIIAHKDSLSTVYGNLSEDSIPQKIFTEHEASKAQLLGESGNSGWQEGQTCLEFKVFDTKNRTSVNPRVLLPRTGREVLLDTGTITLNDKNGISHNLLVERKLPAGTYTVYRTKQDVAVPYITRVGINGATVEEISFDTLVQNNSRLCVTGSKDYNVTKLYPDDKNQLVATVQLTKGLTVLSVTVVNILGQAKSLSYKLDIY